MIKRKYGRKVPHTIETYTLEDTQESLNAFLDMLKGEVTSFSSNPIFINFRPMFNFEGDYDKPVTIKPGDTVYKAMSDDRYSVITLDRLNDNWREIANEQND